MIRRALIIANLATALLGASANGPASAQSQPLTLREALVVAEAAKADALGDPVRRAELFPYRNFPRQFLNFMSAKDARRIDITARYFDVLLVDLEEAATNERMATAYVAFDRLRKSGASLDAIETLQADVRYQELRARRQALRAAQRETRVLLARSIGKPEDPPAEVADVEEERSAEPVPLSRFEDLEKQLRARQGVSTGLVAVNDAGERHHVLLRAWLELQALSEVDLPLAKRRVELADAVLDQERERHARGERHDLGNAFAATVDARRGERHIACSTLLARARINAFVAP